VNKVYDGTTAAAVTLSDNRVSGDVLTASYTNASFADKNVGVGKIVNVSGITVTGTDSGNYTANSTTNTIADITSVTLLVRADDKSRSFGATNPVLTPIYSGFVAGEDTNVLSGAPSLTTPAVESSPVGTYPINISQGTLSAANYTFSFTNGTLTVIELPSVLTIGIAGRPGRASWGGSHAGKYLSRRGLNESFPMDGNRHRASRSGRHHYLQRQHYVAEKVLSRV
jgi:hypothetical protein